MSVEKKCQSESERRRRCFFTDGTERERERGGAKFRNKQSTLKTASWSNLKNFLPRLPVWLYVFLACISMGAGDTILTGNLI